MANIVFIGFMGSGKSTIGFRMARKLGWQFKDIDREIEQLTGMTARQIYKKHGEKRFRSEEALMIKKFAKADRTIIATGDGAVLNKDNVDKLREHGIIIWLHAAPEQVLERIKRSSNRPLLPSQMNLEYISRLMQKREDYYRAAADLVVEVAGKDHNDVLAEVIGKVTEHFGNRI